MCLIIFALNTDSTHRLIVAANRDEFYQRPSLPAHFWNNSKNLLAGKDVDHNGTWLGVTKSGRFAAITNFRRPDKKEYELSRGGLTAAFLENDTKPEEYLRTVEQNQEDYAGFNLLVGDDTSFCYFSNRSNIAPQTLAPGIYGLSNHLLNTPWPKVTVGLSTFTKAVSDSDNNKPEQQSNLLKVLQNNHQAEDSALPNTGISAAFEKMLSSVFIKSPNYGTRASTVVHITKEGEINFLEQNYLSGGVPGEKLNFNL